MEKTTRKKLANWICAVLLALVLAGIGYGFYLRLQGETILGDQFIGVSVLVFAFLLMPIFLVHRWRGKRLQDYTLTKENLEKMRKRD